MSSAGKVLLVTRNLPPLTGGMERLIYHTYQELTRDFDVAVIGPEGCAEFLPSAHNVSTCRLQPNYRFLACLYWKARSVARRFGPVLVFAGSGVAAPAALAAARRCGAPVACYLHGLDLIVPSPLYRMFFLPAIRRCDLLIANSQNTARLAREQGIPASRIEVLHPGAELPDDPDSIQEDSLRREIHARGRTLILSVGRLLPRKGLVDFAERVLPALVAKRPDLLWVVIGSEPKHALKSTCGVSERVRLAVSAAGLQEHVLMLGDVDDSKLRQAYRESDLLVFPVLDMPGDVEGFGMVAVEAAAQGLPTVAFAAGGVPDAVRDGVSGRLVPPGDYSRMTEVILRHLEHENRESWRPRCVGFARAFAWDRFGERLRRICREVIAAHASRSG